jgi:ABC-2 type transport system permease protein
MPVFDQGYQHWNGELAGHGWRWLTITRHGVRTGMKSLVIRSFLLVSLVPALVLVITMCLWGLIERQSDLVAGLSQMLRFMLPKIVQDPRSYRVEVWTICYDRFMYVELWLSMFLIVLVGPNLISQDLRFNALPLYFSRPLRRIDYFIGKLGVIATFLGMTIVVPAVLAYVLGLLFSLDRTILRDTFRILISSIAYGMIVALSAGLLVLALSSLTRSSRYVAMLWLGIWFVSFGLGLLLEGVDQEQRWHASMNQAMVKRQIDFGRPHTMVEQRRMEREWMEAYERIRQEFETEELQRSSRNWRPMVSYMSNLSRIGQQLLGTNARWDSLSQAWPTLDRTQFLYRYRGNDYPWYWSALVLVGLFGLSVWILNFRVKSLDRLK